MGNYATKNLQLLNTSIYWLINSTVKNLVLVSHIRINFAQFYEFYIQFFSPSLPTLTWIIRLIFLILSLLNETFLSFFLARFSELWDYWYLCDLIDHPPAIFIGYRWFLGWLWMNEWIEFTKVVGWWKERLFLSVWHDRW